MFSSRPTFNNEILGLSLSKSDLDKAEPIQAKSVKFFSSHSILAPKSRTTFILFWLGHKPARAGLLIPSIVSKRSLDITNSAPVLPADKDI